MIIRDFVTLNGFFPLSTTPPPPPPNPLLTDNGTMSIWIDYQPKLSKKHNIHTKRNSLDTQAVFIGFSEYVKNRGVVIY